MPLPGSGPRRLSCQLSLPSYGRQGDPAKTHPACINSLLKKFNGSQLLIDKKKISFHSTKSLQDLALTLLSSLTSKPPPSHPHHISPCRFFLSSVSAQLSSLPVSYHLPSDPSPHSPSSPLLPHSHPTGSDAPLLCSHQHPYASSACFSLRPSHAIHELPKSRDQAFSIRSANI